MTTNFADYIAYHKKVDFLQDLLKNLLEGEW
jgi:hypothetical protein